ncbi:MAG: esterase family protein [Flavisolibacter sp.]|nr:esterase family protein [Flavisolibacter sp.]
MKPLLLLLSASLFLNPLLAQEGKKGKVVVERFLAPSLQGNRGGEDPMRRVTIYLPPGYETSNDHYPTIYYLHGFLANDSLMMVWNSFNELMDAAISKGLIRPMILVLPDSDNNYGGSFYTNSSLTGNWADYIGRDVVNYIDKKYRTIPNRASRGLTGHSMGGNGALKIGMLYPDVFGAVYALSPAVLSWAGEFNVNSPAFRGIDTFRNTLSGMEIINILSKGEPDASLKFYTQVMAALARAYSPADNNTFLSAAMPVRYVRDSMVVNEAVEKKWEANFPINMIESHLAALKSLTALKMDWGRNEENTHIPPTCLAFSKKLEAYGVKHYAEEYIGGHVDKQGGWDGRMYTEMLPFFDTYLKQEAKAIPAVKTAKTKKAK